MSANIHEKIILLQQYLVFGFPPLPQCDKDPHREMESRAGCFPAYPILVQKS
jgi:hypothetical protein